MHVGVGLSGDAEAKGTNPTLHWFVCCGRKRGHLQYSTCCIGFINGDVLAFLFTAGVAKNHSKYLHPFQAKAREKHERHQFLGMSSYDKFHELANRATFISWSQILTSLNEPVLDTHCCDIKKAISARRLAGLMLYHWYILGLTSTTKISSWFCSCKFWCLTNLFIPVSLLRVLQRWPERRERRHPLPGNDSYPHGAVCCGQGDVHYSEAILSYEYWHSDNITLGGCWHCLT